MVRSGARALPMHLRLLRVSGTVGEDRVETRFLLSAKGFTVSPKSWRRGSKGRLEALICLSTSTPRMGLHQADSEVPSRRLQSLRGGIS